MSMRSRERTTANRPEEWRGKKLKGEVATPPEGERHEDYFPGNAESQTSFFAKNRRKIAAFTLAAAGIGAAFGMGKMSEAAPEPGQERISAGATPTPGEASPEAPLTNEQILASYDLDENLALGESAMDYLNQELQKRGSAPMVVNDPQSFNVLKPNPDLEFDMDVVGAEQMDKNLTVYANILNANKDSSSYESIRKAGIQHIVMDTGIKIGSGDEPVVDITKNEVAYSLNEYVQALPEGAVIDHVKLISFHNENLASYNGFMVDTLATDAAGNKLVGGFLLTQSPLVLEAKLNNPFIMKTDEDLLANTPLEAGFYNLGNLDAFEGFTFESYPVEP